MTNSPTQLCSRNQKAELRRLADRELFSRIAISYRICRIYAEHSRHNTEPRALGVRL